MPTAPSDTLFAQELLDENPVIIKRFQLPMGQNSKDQPGAIEIEEAATLTNVDTTSKGVCKTRLGYTMIADDTGTSLRIPGLGKFYIEGGTKYLTRVNSTKWEGWTGSGSWTQITGATLTSNLVTNFVVAGNRQFLLNGTDNVFSTANGTSATDEANTNTDPPRSRFGIYLLNMLILSGNSTNRSYIWPSTVLDPQTFDRATRVIKVADQNGDEITALAALSLTSEPGFIAFKERSSHFVNMGVDPDPALWTDPTNWAIVEIDPVHGCVGSRGATVVGSSLLKGDCVFLSKEGATYRVRALRRTISDAIGTGGILSLAIEDVLSDVNDALMLDAIVYYFDERLFVAFPSGSGTYNNTLAVLDLRNSSPEENKWKWSIWTGLNIGSISTYVENNIEYLYFGEASASAKVYRALNGTSDAGTAISFTEESRREDFGLPELYKSFQVAVLEFLTTDDSTVTVQAQIDGGGYSTLTAVPNAALEGGGPHLPIALPFSLSSQGKLYKSYQLDDLGQGHDIQLKVTHSSLDDSISFLGYWIAAFLEPLNLEVRS